MKKPAQPRPPKLTDAERYKRFLDAAKQVGASDRHEDFDVAFHKVAGVGKSLGSATKSKGAT